MKNKNQQIPQDGIAGLKENFREDALSGFLVFLLALPLSLGIAQASDFPPIMGLMTAMIGGLFVSFLAGSPLTIKGPAAGLIVIVAGAVSEFGQGDAELGWKMALGAIFIAGIFQIVFGMLKAGTIVDLFPLSAVHGMLAAIGIIIFSKQIHILLGVNPLNNEGKSIIEPFELLSKIPETFGGLNVNASIVGGLSLIIILLWPRIRNKWLNKIPAPIAVLMIAIPAAKWLSIDNKYFIHFEHNLAETLAWDVDFRGLAQTAIFWKYVVMFALVGSLESLLTVKAIDSLDPWKRRSNANKDLIGVGAGNAVASVIGGLPMISEVARSSANVNNGGRTRWANFFHGIFIMVFLILDMEFNDIIPKPALAAMLIGVAVKLASPKSFGEMAKIGTEQLIVFITTIVVTLATDLLIGIFAGVVVKFITQLILGTPVGAVFKAHIHIKGNEVRVAGAAVFSNWIAIKRKLKKFDSSDTVIINLNYCNLVDYTVIDNLHHLRLEYEANGGELVILGLDEFKFTGKHNHHHATRNRNKEDRHTLAELKKLMSE